MPVLCGEVMAAMEELAPRAFAMGDDNVGLQVGDPGTRVEHVLVTLDVDLRVIQEAINLGAGMIIAHHPMFFKPIRQVNRQIPLGLAVSEALKAGLTIFSAHTNLDSVPGGINTVLGERLGMVEGETLKPYYWEKQYKLIVFVPGGYESKVLDAISAAGAGHIGNYDCCSFRARGTGTYRPLEGSTPFIGEEGRLEETEEFRLEVIVTQEKLRKVIHAMLAAHPYEEVAYDVIELEKKGRAIGLGLVGSLIDATSLAEFQERVRKSLKVPHLKVVGDPKRSISRVAICGGAGFFLLPEALASGADVFVTGDVGYHGAQEARDAGMAVIDAGHYPTEAVILPKVAEFLAAKLNGALRVSLSRVVTDPFCRE